MKPRFIPYKLPIMSHVAKWQQPCRPGVNKIILSMELQILSVREESN